MLCKIVIKAHTSLLLVLPPLKWIVSSPRPSWSGLSDQFVALPVIWGVCRVGTQGSVCPIHSFCLRTVPSSLTEFFFFRNSPPFTLHGVPGKAAIFHEHILWPSWPQVISPELALTESGPIRFLPWEFKKLAWRRESVPLWRFQWWVVRLRRALRVLAWNFLPCRGYHYAVRNGLLCRENQSCKMEPGYVSLVPGAPKQSWILAFLSIWSFDSSLDFMV